MSFTRKKHTGASYTYFWYVCGFATDKGPDVCKHRAWYRREWLEAAIVDRFHQAMTAPVVNAIVQAVNANITAWGERRDQRLTQLKSEVGNLERQAAHLVAYLKQGRSSPTVRAELEATEEAMGAIRLELTAAEHSSIPIPEIEPARIKARIGQLYELLRKDPVRAKREMTKHLAGDPAITPLVGAPGQQASKLSNISMAGGA